MPDLVAKVSILKFEQVPPRVNDLEQLVRWQVRKTAPFPIDEAQISYVAGQRAADGQEFLVSLARRDVIAEYEQLAAAAGRPCGHCRSGDVQRHQRSPRWSRSAREPPGTGCSSTSTSEYATLAVVRGPHIVLFRSRGADADSSLADLVHQTTMYYEDRLHGTGFARVILAGGPPGGRHRRRAARSLQERLSTTVEALDLRAVVALTNRISGTAATLDTLAPLVGVLVRGREAAA